MKLYLKKAEDMTIKNIINLREFRKPKEPLQSSTGYMICPTCKAAFGIEGVGFCSSCGQKLRWTNYWKKEKRKEQITDQIILNSHFNNFKLG